MQTRTIKRADGTTKTVHVHGNGGLRKRCGCPRRAWAKCSHPWHFSFKWKGTHQRFQLDKYAAEPITDKDKARTEADRLRAAIRAGTFPPPVPACPATPAELTFAAGTDKWQERARVTASDRQRKDDESKITRLSALTIDSAPLGERLIGRITEDDIETALLQLSTLGGSTWNKYIDTIRMIERWFLEKGYLQRPWVRAASWKRKDGPLARKKAGKRERRLVPDEVGQDRKVAVPGEERRLLDVASPWLQRLIIAALETCCRLGELLSLQWSDVDLRRGEITIRAENAKDDEMRKLPISPRLRAVLEMIRLDPAGKEHKLSAFVFGNAIGEQVGSPKKQWETTVLRANGHTPSWVKGKLSAESRAKLREISLHFHDLRHEAGSRLLEAGWPLTDVQAMLGHSDAKTTSIYLNTTARHLQESMRRYGTQAPVSGHPLHSVAPIPPIDPRPQGNGDEAKAGNVLVN